MSGVVRPRRSDACVLETIADGYLVYDPRTERVTELNDSAVVVWQLCDGTRTEEEIVALVADAFPESRDRVRDDVIATLARLTEAGCVQPAPESAEAR